MAFVQSPFYHMLPYSLDPSSSHSTSSNNNNTLSPISTFSDSSSSSSSSSLEDEDELSAMFQSDSFSLESGRDRDLKSLGNILELSLGASSRGNSPPMNSYEADDIKSHFNGMGGRVMGGYNDSSSFASTSKSMYEVFNTQQSLEPHYPFSSNSQYQPTSFSSFSEQTGQQQHQSTPHVTPQFMNTPLPSTSSNEYEISSYPSQLSPSTNQFEYQSGEIYSTSNNNFTGRPTHSYSHSNPQYISPTPSSSYTSASPFSNFNNAGNDTNFVNTSVKGCRAPAASRERSRSDSLPSYQQSEQGYGGGDYEMED